MGESKSLIERDDPDTSPHTERMRFNSVHYLYHTNCVFMIIKLGATSVGIRYSKSTGTYTDSHPEEIEGIEMPSVWFYREQSETHIGVSVEFTDCREVRREWCQILQISPVRTLSSYTRVPLGSFHVKFDRFFTNFLHFGRVMGEPIHDIEHQLSLSEIVRQMMDN